MMESLLVLQLISKALAVTDSEISQQLNVSVDDLKKTLQQLTERNLVRARESGAKEESVIYTITADGVRELDKSVKRGVAALL